MKDLKALFYSTGIIPVIKIESLDKADGLAQALRSSGIHVAEITFRTKTAPGVIERFASRHSDILVGAGTVTTKEEVDSALSAGAAFVVSPGFNPVICSYCIEKGVPVFPGVNNPSLIEQAIAMGLSVLKFFPAEVSGGVKALKAFESVYSSVSFIPTGGIQENNINEYLALKNVLACGGSWIVPTDLIEAGKFEAIEGLIGSARRTMLGFLPLQHGDRGLNREKADARARIGDGAAIEVKTTSLRRSLAMLQAEGFSSVPGSEVMRGQSMAAAEIEIPSLHGRIRLVE
ncbi:MAG: bifunctional 4-hydroxy-2-oxoglutarate aldolase/2-dehydro-3-deoxy-phosphogluconate aldolase [Spirochaetota bacterium]|jgi:2-dehydro-3-deoxyphosphogluconate aldolase/(4S)-4-hydroxy-2-oxoglutarate aldolase